MAQATIVPGQIRVGPGILRWAPLGTTIPADPAAGVLTAYAAGWKEIGATDEGHEFTSEISTEDIEVAERATPIRTDVTNVTENVAFAMAQSSVANLNLAFNGTTDTTAGLFTKQVPTAVSSMVRRMLAWDSEDGLERWVWPQVFNSGSIAMSRSKAPDKTVIAVTFRIEEPATGDRWVRLAQTATFAPA